MLLLYQVKTGAGVMMPEFFSQWLPTTAAFMPHGFCFQWMPQLLSLHVISDAFIVLAYFSIPITLWFFVRRRADLPFKWVFLLFAAFIVACGTTHLMGVVTIWYPAYWLSGWIKALTAAVSIATAAALVPLMPKALALPSPAELRRYSNTLEAEVALRTRELETSNRQLAERLEELQRTQADLMAAREQAELARQIAEEANRSKSRFLANMSHELRTPLNGILGFAQSLQHAPQSSEQHQGLAVIQQSGEHLLSLINDILDLARVESGRLELRTEAVDIEALLQEVVGPLQNQAEQKGLTLSVEVLRPLPAQVQTDPRRLRQILTNLLGNAVKFTQVGAVSLRVEPSLARMEFIIQDTGPGIARDVQQSIFEPFHQLDPNVEGGTGLGLAITRELVVLMGGEIRLQSEPGQGSMFSVSLPLSALEPVEDKPEAQGRITGYQGEQRTILVVDDRRENRLVAESLLTPLGFKVFTADGAEQAMEVLQKHPVDLILMDLVMPEVDGLTFTRQLKRNPTLDAIPVVMASASAYDYHRIQSREAGAAAFLPKPLQRERLLRLIGGILDLPWRYEETTEVAEQGHAKATELLDLRLNEQQLRALLALASVGNNRALRAALQDLLAELGESAALTALLQLAEQYQHETLCERLNRQLEKI